jgi:hypothetical protein
MLICRCAWHSRYYGYPLLSGVASWRGWTLRFTDGICPRCLARFRREHHSLFERSPEPGPIAAPPEHSLPNEAA